MNTIRNTVSNAALQPSQTITTNSTSSENNRIKKTTDALSETSCLQKSDSRFFSTGGISEKISGFLSSYFPFSKIRENSLKTSNQQLSLSFLEAEKIYNQINNLKTEIDSLEIKGKLHQKKLESLIADRANYTTKINYESGQSEVQDLHLPLLNMQDFYDTTQRGKFLEKLREAITQHGFFAVQNVGINREIINQAYEQSQKFFNQPPSFKEQSSLPQLKGQRGWVPGEKAKGSLIKDDKEFFHIGSEKSAVPNVWPSQTGFKEAMNQMYKELDRYTNPLLQAITEAINLRTPKEQAIPSSLLFDSLGNGENNLLRALYYPAVEEEKLKNPKQPHCWGAPHTDIDLITILPYATAKGLQLQKDGKWFNVIVPEDAFVVNIGDMLENMTNGLTKSSRHRIVAQTANEPRFSCVFFVHPKSDANLKPIDSCIAQTGGKQKYAEGTRDEFLFERLLELGIAPGLLDLYYKTGHIFRQMEFGRESPEVLKMLQEKFSPSTI